MKNLRFWGKKRPDGGTWYTRGTWQGDGIGRHTGLWQFERCYRNIANEPKSIGKRCKIPIPRQTGKPEAVETAIWASRPDGGTVQTTNPKGVAKAIVVRKSCVPLGRAGSIPALANKLIGRGIKVIAVLFCRYRQMLHVLFSLWTQGLEWQ